MEKHIHIICLDVPYPPDYGGVFDLFYKLKYLHRAGILVHLHCFEYGRGQQDELKKYCHTVHYYPRKLNRAHLLGGIPYMVSSRADSALWRNLSKDHYPALIEGIHCSFLLYKNKLRERKVILRLHNIEFDYYRLQSRHAPAGFKKLYYYIESLLLKRYEKKLSHKPDLVFTVTNNDRERYVSIFGRKDARYLPVFIPWNHLSSKEGRGEYCLYHGNLSISENEGVALWLIETVFTTLHIPFIIAGKNPSANLKKKAAKVPHIRIIESPDEETMQELIEDAQVNILPSFTNTGIKLKLLHALYCGRHCLVNDNMVTGTGLESLCRIGNKAEELTAEIQKIFKEPFTDTEMTRRLKILQSNFDNNKNAATLISMVWE